MLGASTRSCTHECTSTHTHTRTHVRMRALFLSLSVSLAHTQTPPHTPNRTNAAARTRGACDLPRAGSQLGFLHRVAISTLIEDFAQITFNFRCDVRYFSTFFRANLTHRSKIKKSSIQKIQPTGVSAGAAASTAPGGGCAAVCPLEKRRGASLPCGCGRATAARGAQGAPSRPPTAPQLPELGNGTARRGGPCSGP